MPEQHPTTDRVERGSPDAREIRSTRVQVALAALIVAGVAAWTLAYGVPKGRVEVAVICMATALALSGGDLRAWGGSLVRVWLPLFGLLGAYDFVRGYADETGRSLRVMPQIHFDAALTGGTNPTVWMQQRLWSSGNPHWWDYLAWATYTSHFFVPFGIVLYLWYRRDHRFARYMQMFVALTLAAITTYLLVPAAPPWMASNMGKLSPTTRIVHAMWSHAGASGAAQQWSPDAPHTFANKVAALPSLHGALPMLICLFFWAGASRRMRVVLAAYPLLMGWTLVYGAEHYVFDVVLGWAYAAAIVAAPALATSLHPHAQRGWQRAALAARARPEPAVLVGAATLAVLLRVPAFRLPLGVDEGGAAFIAHAWMFGHSPTTAVYHQYWFDRPPLDLVIMAAAGIAGDMGVRLAGAACAAVVTVVVGSIAGEFARSAAPSCRATQIRASALAALTTAGLLASPIISGERTDSLLVGLVPATCAVLFAVRALRTSATWYWFAAGLCVAAALLCKQSFLDPGFVVAIALVVCVRRAGARHAARGLAAAAAGASVPLGSALVWIFLVSGLTVEKMVRTLLTSRLDVLHALSVSERTPLDRMAGLAGTALMAGIVVILALVPIAYVRRTPTGRPLMKALTLLLGGWLLAGFACMLAGGYYWPHYWIQLVPVIAVLAAMPAMLGWASARGAAVAPVVSVVFTLGATAVIAGAAPTPLREGTSVEKSIGHYVHANSQRGDSIVVVYSRANVAWYAGLPSTSPYLWSSAYRTFPAAQRQLRRSLTSARRPTWIVEWQSTRSFGLDRDGSTRRAIDEHYRLVATICDHPILIRRDERRAIPAPAPQTCPIEDLSETFGKR
jgi:hypothetical protein